MIICEHHETGACLRLDPEKSVIEFDSDGNLAKVEEHYECIGEELAGIYRWVYATEIVNGCILDDGKAPHTIAYYRKMAGGDRGETA